jgi:hypothetical protein
LAYCAALCRRAVLAKTTAFFEHSGSKCIGAHALRGVQSKLTKRAERTVAAGQLNAAFLYTQLEVGAARDGKVALTRIVHTFCYA